MMFLRNKLQELQTRVSRFLREEEWSRLMGFGRIEKARAQGRIEAYRNILSWCNFRESEIAALFKQAEEDVRKYHEDPFRLYGAK